MGIAASAPLSLPTTEAEPGEAGGYWEHSLFRMGGGCCKEELVAWAKCVQEAEAAGDQDSVAERCRGVTAAIRKCMDAHAGCYDESIVRGLRRVAAEFDAAACARREASAGSESSAD